MHDHPFSLIEIASPTEAPAEENFDSVDQPAGLEPLDRAPAEPVSAELAPADEAESQTYDAADGVGTDVAAVAGSASSDDPQSVVTAAHDAGERQAGVESAARRQRSRAKKAGEAVVVAPVSSGAHSASDDTMSLDKEIRVLKGQLAIKLQMQNAQLKKMLERFER